VTVSIGLVIMLAALGSGDPSAGGGTGGGGGGRLLSIGDITYRVVQIGFSNRLVGAAAASISQ
jgi:hypothetical protein